MEAKAAGFDWIMSKDVRDVGEFSSGVCKALSERHGGSGKVGVVEDISGKEMWARLGIPQNLGKRTAIV
jgi:hypothetical protein